jgi:ribosomal protein L11 methyltransferase
VSIEEAIKPNSDERGWAEGWQVDLERPAMVSAFVPLDERAEAVRRRVEEGLWHLGQMLPVYAFETEVLSEEDWASAWREHFHVHRVGRRLVIKPSWREYEPQPGEHVIELDPGMAFGTGLHPTTQLCLQELEERVRAGLTVADVGTGSGILSIAAVLLGAKSVLACDVDSVAVDAARENSRLNGMQNTVEVRLGTLAGDKRALAPGQQFDLVVANIVADVIATLMPELYAATAPGATAIFSGIIESKEERVAEALAAAGFQMAERRQQGDWVMVAATRPADGATA